MAPPCASSRCPRRTPPSLGLVPPRASSRRRPSHLDRAPSTPQQNQVATPLPFIFSSALFSPPRNLSLPLQELLHHAMAAPELASFPGRPRRPSELARPRRGFPAVARLVVIAPRPTPLCLTQLVAGLPCLGQVGIQRLAARIQPSPRRQRARCLLLARPSPSPSLFFSLFFCFSDYPALFVLPAETPWVYFEQLCRRCVSASDPAPRGRPRPKLPVLLPPVSPAAKSRVVAVLPCFCLEQEETLAAPPRSR